VDLTKPAEVTQAFERIDAAWGGLDVLVNNAGTCFMSDFPDIPAEEFDRQMQVNFYSAFHCCQAAVPRMLRREGVKKIVNISSNGAYNFDVFDPPHYRASKAAMDNLTKDLARRYARERIAVNSIAPAMTETPLFGVLTQDVLDRAIAQMPHGRAMQPRDRGLGVLPRLPRGRHLQRQRPDPQPGPRCPLVVELRRLPQLRATAPAHARR
jgi:NAD(P)-dependent dehydrogenase (short-subunit alcohol dehydrogenase family)